MELLKTENLKIHFETCAKPSCYGPLKHPPDFLSIFSFSKQNIMSAQLQLMPPGALI